MAKLPLALLSNLIALFKVTALPLLFFSITLNFPLVPIHRPTAISAGFDDFASNGAITYDQIARLAGDASTPRPPTPPLPAKDLKVTGSTANVGTMNVGTLRTAP
jgi:hypothetical protein